MKSLHIALKENEPFLGSTPLFIDENNQYNCGDALYCLHEYLYPKIVDCYKVVNEVERLALKSINKGILKGSIKVSNYLGGDTYYFEVI
jgi:Mor family transcriptional regulator